MTKDNGELNKRLIEDVKKIVKDLKELNIDIDDTSEDVDDIKDNVEDIKKEVDDTGEDVDKIIDHVEDIRKEVDDTGEDVDKIIDHVEDIKKEVDDTGEDVDEIKDEIKDIKKGISELKKSPSLFSRVKNAVPEKFHLKDVAQQIVGATIVSAPFAVTEEVWRLSNKLSLERVIAIILITIIFDILLFHFARFRQIKKERIANIIPLRITALLLVTYTTSTTILLVFGIIGNQIVDIVWSAKLVVLVGLFANIGAGTADLIK